MSKVKLSVWKTGPPPRKGQRQQYPSRFWFNFKKEYPLAGARVLHMFSGSMDWGDTTDMRPDSGAKIVAPFNALPIPDNVYDWVIADPPYTTGFQHEWTSLPDGLPKPKHILQEAARVTKPGGRIAILHIIVIRPHTKITKVRRIALHWILCGENNVPRTLNVFRKMRTG